MHDSHNPSYILHEQLAMMDGETLPLAIGVIRDVGAPTYEQDVESQVADVRSRRGFSSLRDMILATSETWEA